MRYLLKPDEKLVSEITQKSYCSLISDIDQQRDVMSKDEKEARNASLYYFEKKQLTVFVESVLKATDARLMQNKESEKETLKNIKEEYIIYTEDTVLGYDVAKQYGSNAYGEHLMKIRSQLIEEDLKKRKNEVNVIYSLLKSLRIKIRNCESDLAEYIDVHYNDILLNENIVLIELNNDLLDKYIRGDGNVDIRKYNEADVDVIRQINFFLQNPTKMAEYLRFKYHVDYNAFVEEKQKENLYKHYISTLFKNTKPMLLQQLKDKVYHLKNSIENLLMLSKPDDYELTPVPIENVSEIEIDDSEWVYKPLQKDKGMYLIDKNNLLSPSHINRIEIGLLSYVSVNHYGVVKMINELKYGEHRDSMKKSQGLIRDINHFFEEYHRLKNEYIHYMVKQTAEDILKETLKKSDMMHLLSQLKNTNIVYESSDMILGNGIDGNGENVVGRFLEQFLKKNKTMIETKLNKMKTLSGVYTDQKKLEYAIEKARHIYDMALLLVENVKIYKIDKRKIDAFSEQDACVFISNFICIPRQVPRTFYKDGVPVDFKRVLDREVNKETLLLLYKYTTYYYYSLFALEKDDNRTFEEILSIKNMGRLVLKDVNIEEYPLVDPLIQLSVFKEKDVSEKRFRKDFDKSEIEYDKFLITEESEYSSLMPKHVKQVKHIFNNWFVDDSGMIVDATAHIGVDTIHFHKMFPKSDIVSYEISPNTFRLLSQNIKTLGNDKIHAVNLDFSQYYLKLNEDLKWFGKNKGIKMESNKISFVYIDAPWGGRDYKNVPMNQFELYLSNKNVKDIARELIMNNITKNVVLKVPRNYRFSGLDFFDVKRENVMDGKKISYVLLKLTMKSSVINRLLKLKTLLIDSFFNIFETLKVFIDVTYTDSNSNTFYSRQYVIDENSILFANRLLGGIDLRVSFNQVSESDVNLKLFKRMLKYTYSETDPESDEEVLEVLIGNQQMTKLALLLQRAIQKIMNMIDSSNIDEMIGTIYKHSKSTKFSYNNIYVTDSEDTFDEKDYNEDDKSDESDNESDESDESDRSDRSDTESVSGRDDQDDFDDFE